EPLAAPLHPRRVPAIERHPELVLARAQPIGRAQEQRATRLEHTHALGKRAPPIGDMFQQLWHETDVHGAVRPRQIGCRAELKARLRMRAQPLPGDGDESLAHVETEHSMTALQPYGALRARPAA